MFHRTPPRPARHLPRHPLVRTAATLLAAGLFLPLSSQAHARLGAQSDAPLALPGQQPPPPDLNALTDDHSTTTPTAWWTYNGVSASQISGFINSNHARLTELEVDGLDAHGAPLFSVRMVSNSGAYAVPGWWWYVGLTASELQAQLSANNARLIELAPYDAGGGQVRFAAVMVSNTGVAARAWSWLVGVSSAQLSTHLSQSGHRLIDLNTYVEGGVKKYSAVMVANTGTDAKSWQWWLNLTPSAVATKVKAFNGRIVKLVRQADGSYDLVQVANTGADSAAWWYGMGFSSMTAVNNYALQLAARPVDISSYLDTSGRRRYDAAFIDNANAGTQRMRAVYGQTFLDANGSPTRGIFEAVLKEVGQAPSVALNIDRRAEAASGIKSFHLLHALKQVELGSDGLSLPFTYYNYPQDPHARPEDACPDPAAEIPANQMNDKDFGAGLAVMMSQSDNRSTRGTVLRYGGFAGFNAAAPVYGLGSTTLRHNTGCGYRNLQTGKYDPAGMRNDTSVADLAHIYEGVWQGSLLTSQHDARNSYLQRANPSQGVNISSALGQIIQQEATAQGKAALATTFASQVAFHGKGGSYGTCLPDANGACGQRVIVRSGAGLIHLPYKVAGQLQYRDFAYGHLISDVPVACFEDWSTQQTECPSETNYVTAFGQAAAELFREEIRAALVSW